MEDIKLEYQAAYKKEDLILLHKIDLKKNNCLEKCFGVFSTGYINKNGKDH